MSDLLLLCPELTLFCTGQNYLKTAFILTNQNWVIFSCQLLGLKLDLPLLVSLYQTRAVYSFDLEIMHMISDQTAFHSIQLLLIINSYLEKKALYL